MQLGMIGLGRMGGGMTRRLLARGHDVVVHDVDKDAMARLVADGARRADSHEALAEALDAPRAVWVMVPAGGTTERVIDALSEHLKPGDIVIDGGNSHFKDSVRRAERLAKQGIFFLDAGTSGGVWGEARGYCLMVGGAPEAFAYVTPIFEALAPGRGDVVPAAGREGRASTAEGGYLHCGPAGAGHFVKMVHNGIEYGLMQAYAEGFDILKRAAGDDIPEHERYPIDVADVAELWRRGSVVGSWLLDLTANALAEDPDLRGFEGRVADSGEGRWTVETAVERATPAPVLTAALYARFRSRQSAPFADRLLSAMRYQFGGHREPR